ncbi:MAG: hypothetical protein H3Z51_05640 [archaeon]|nr:hypothetical protein [archaeon]
MPEREDAEFQIEMLRIQIQNEITTEFYVAMIAIGFAALLSLGISLTWGPSEQGVIWLQTVVMMIYVVVLYAYWRRRARRIDKEIENLRRRFLNREKVV